MSGRFFKKVFVIFVLFICVLGVTEVSNVAQANAAWEGSGYMVLQYGTHLKTFDNLTDAINYAKQWDHTRVYGVSSGELYWDNYHVQVYQYNTYLGDFGSRLGAIAYAEGYDHTKVVDASDHGIVYWQWSYTIDDFIKHLNNDYSDADGIDVYFKSLGSENNIPYIGIYFSNPDKGYSSFLDDEIYGNYGLTDWGNSILDEYAKLFPNSNIRMAFIDPDGNVIMTIAWDSGMKIVSTN